MQMHRVNPNVMEALLRTFTLISNQVFDKDESSDQLSRDLVLLLLKILRYSECVSSQDQNIFKYALTNLINLQKTFPQINEELNKLVVEYSGKLKDEIFIELFPNQ